MWFGNQSGTGDQTVDDDGDNKRAKGENHEEEDEGVGGGDRAGRARVIRPPPVIVIGQSAVTQRHSVTDGKTDSAMSKRDMSLGCEL